MYYFYQIEVNFIILGILFQFSVFSHVIEKYIQFSNQENINMKTFPFCNTALISLYHGVLRNCESYQEFMSCGSFDLCLHNGQCVVAETRWGISSDTYLFIQFNPLQPSILQWNTKLLLDAAWNIVGNPERWIDFAQELKNVPSYSQNC